MTLFSDPSYGPVLTFILISFIISLATLIVYKFTTNQNVMKQLRDDIKKYQEQMKNTKDTEKMLQIQKKAMDVNMKYMMQSMRPTIFTILPILLVFGWVAANLSFAQILPGEVFDVQVKVGSMANDSRISVIPSGGLELVSQNDLPFSPVMNFSFKGQEGKHTIDFKVVDEVVTKDVLVTSRWDFVKPVMEKGQGFLEKIFNSGTKEIPIGSAFVSITTMHKPVHPFGSFSLFGYMPGWVMTYVTFSIIFNIALRKVMNLH